MGLDCPPACTAQARDSRECLDPWSSSPFEQGRLRKRISAVCRALQYYSADFFLAREHAPVNGNPVLAHRLSVAAFDGLQNVMQIFVPDVFLGKKIALDEGFSIPQRLARRAGVRRFLDCRKATVPLTKDRRELLFEIALGGCFLEAGILLVRDAEIIASREHFTKWPVMEIVKE